MFIKFWGVHGSLPRPGPSTLKYGGNTACVEVRCGNVLIIFDAGSGIRELGEDLSGQTKNCEDQAQRIKGHIFFSHLHWDHVQGFPFFDPIYCKNNEFHLYGARKLDSTVHRILSDQMCEPNFPVLLDRLPAALTFHDVASGDRVSIDDVTVRVQSLNHPGGSFGYRVDFGGGSLVYATDTEQVEGVNEAELELSRDADVLICDSMFDPDQYLGLWDDIPRKSWGHNTWEGAVQLAEAARAKRLVLFHHGNDDRVVGEMERSAQERFPHAIAAYEGLVIEI